MYASYVAGLQRFKIFVSRNCHPYCKFTITCMTKKFKLEVYTYTDQYSLYKEFTFVLWQRNKIYLNLKFFTDYFFSLKQAQEFVEDRVR